MCIEDWTIKSTPVCLTEPNQNYQKKKKKILRNSSQRGLMTEINVCKTIRQKVYAVFYDMKC